MDDTVEKVLSMMSEADREYFEERASIREYCGNIKPRALAETLGILDILKANPMALLGVHVLKLKVDGEFQHFLATNETYQRISATSCEITEETDLAAVLDSVFNGMAMLGKKKILYEGKLF